MRSLAIVAALTAGLVLELGAQRPTPATQVRVHGGTPAPRLVQPSDFEPLGYWDIRAAQWTQGFTVRRVNGELRFLLMQTTPSGSCTTPVPPETRLACPGRLDEYAAGGAAWGSVLPRTRSWPDIYEAKYYTGRHYGLWLQAAKRRLWLTVAVDYPDDPYITRGTQVYTRSLDDAGTLGPLVGPIVVGNVSPRLAHGAIVPVPPWFQAQHQVGAYATCCGGYNSRITAGVVSLGPALHAFPEPTSLAIPPSAVQVLTNHPFTQNDWYRSGVPQVDRGQRLDAPLNYYDAAPLPVLPPTVPPNGRWLSPAPDGKARWTWGDSNWQTGVWIDTPTCRAFMTAPSLRTGRNWYQNSTLHSDGRTFELHLVDPAQLGEVADGRRDPSAVQPYSMTSLALPGVPLGGKQGSGPNGMAMGAEYDPVDGRLYIAGTGVSYGPAPNNEYVRVFAYRLRCA